jgi:arabinofuranosyltransferase
MKRFPPSIRLLLTVFLFSTHVWIFRGFIVDDAFITFRYVRQWTHGNGLVYNIGDRVEGYSNFLWILLLTPFDFLGIELVLAAKGLGILLSFLTLLVTWRFAQRFSIPDVASLLLAASSPFAAWSVGGLETPLFTFLLAVSGYTLVREEEEGRGWLSGFLFGLLALTRPEGLLFALAAAAFRGWRLYRLDSRPERRDLLRLLGLIALVGPYFWWRFTYYGYPLPNTVYAKSMGLHPRALLEGLFYLYRSFAVAGGFFFLALPFALALVRPERSMLVEYLSCNITVYGLFVILAGGDWMPMQRFMVHILPFLYLLVQGGLVRLSKIWQTRWSSLLPFLLVGGQVGYFLIASLEQRFVDGVGKGPLVPDGGARVAYLCQYVRPGDTIAVIDAGIIAYRLPLETRVVDMVGLTDVHIAHQPVRLPGGLFGRGDAFGKWDVDYILAQKPCFVEVNILGKTVEGEWLTNFTGTTLLINDRRFRRAYRLVTEPGVSGVFVRKEIQ